jgi:hypothetical protein
MLYGALAQHHEMMVRDVDDKSDKQMLYGALAQHRKTMVRDVDDKSDKHRAIAHALAQHREMTASERR